MTTQNGPEVATHSSWQFDPYHTQVDFTAKHLGMMTVRGHFAEVTATGFIDPAHPEASSVDVSIPTASIHTNHPARDNDLRSSNFLEAEKYPTITYKSTKIEPSSENHYKVTGDLTLKGTTLPVVLNVEKYGEFHDPAMGHRIGYSAEGKINRKDFGMTFNALLDGKWVVSDEVNILIEGEFVEKPAEAPASTASAQ